jgi:hypothetical protein
MGLSGWWSLLVLTGAGMIVGPWILAYCAGPRLNEPKFQTNALPEAAYRRSRIQAS